MNKNKLTIQQGFSLLEILVAFSILALSLGILLKIFSGGLNHAETASDYTNAVQIAESIMARTGTDIPLKAFRDAGTENDRYRWEINIKPYNIVSEKLDTQKLPVELYKVSVSVDWGDGDSDDRHLELNTLKLAGKDNAGL